MKQLLLLTFLFQFSLYAMGAKNKDHWYKVESKKPEKKQESPNPYPYDSVEKSAPDTQFYEIGFWSLRPKLSLSGGFHADKAVLKEGESNRFFFNTGLHFFNHPWYRINANILLLQNNSMFVGTSWEYTASRKSSRDYFGVGVAHRLISEKEFNNLVEGESYYLTAHYGLEFLLKSQRGISVELKGYYSSNNYALQLAFGYIIPL